MDVGWNVGDVTPMPGGVTLRLFREPYTSYLPGIETDGAYGNDLKDAIHNYLFLLKEKQGTGGP